MLSSTFKALLVLGLAFAIQNASGFAFPREHNSLEGNAVANSRLFEPLKLGNMYLKHRIAMSPMNRYRADDNHTPLPFVPEYFVQRAVVRGTFIITGATFISKSESSLPNSPAIFNQEQINLFKKVTKGVHEKGSYIYVQLYAPGRVANLAYATSKNLTVVSSSPTQLGPEFAVPKEMTKKEIDDMVMAYAQAAKNAIAAGFDGVEIHGGNGYLIDQFTQDVCNKRTDHYGGSVENRSRFAVEVMEAVVRAIGAHRTAVRLSPFATYQGMKMDDPFPQFIDLVKRLDKLHLSYIHFIESRVSGTVDVPGGESLDRLIAQVNGPVVLAGGYTPENAKDVVDKERKNRTVVIAFGRPFVSNPDLVFRVENNIPFSPINMSTLYLPTSAAGYIDYPYSKQFEAENKTA